MHAHAFTASCTRKDRNLFHKINFPDLNAFLSFQESLYCVISALTSNYFVI